jgi:hypothetical protein
MDRDAKGIDLNTETGTRDAVDPDTGAIGTAGTPVTGGYAASGSSIGLGTQAGESEHTEGDYAGTTPASKAYTEGHHGDSHTRITTEDGAVLAREKEVED